MKAILMSDRAYWCALMMNGIKTVEVRKGTALYKATQKLIDEYGFAEFFVYCTKGKPYLGKKEIGRNFYNEHIYTYDLDYGETFKGSGNKKFYSSVGVYSINGKVIFKFRCYKVEEIKSGYYVDRFILNKSCLNHREMSSYLKGKVGCAIHISDLEVFGKPKELRKFKHWFDCDKCWCDDNHSCLANKLCPKYISLTKAPQSFAYIEVGE